MPFGLCNAPATFERMMDNLLRHLKWTMCLCYLDDIVVFSKNFDEHLDRLNAVLSCDKEAGLILNVKKCLFAAQKIQILGHGMVVFAQIRTKRKPLDASQHLRM